MRGNVLKLKILKSRVKYPYVLTYITLYGKSNHVTQKIRIMGQYQSSLGTGR